MPSPEAGMLDPVQQAAECHRREGNRQRLRELRIQRLNDRAERMGHHKEASTTAVPVMHNPDKANQIHAAAITIKNTEPSTIRTDNNTTRELST